MKMSSFALGYSSQPDLILGLVQDIINCVSVADLAFHDWATEFAQQPFETPCSVERAGNGHQGWQGLRGIFHRPGVTTLPEGELIEG